MTTRPVRFGVEIEFRCPPRQAPLHVPGDDRIRFMATIERNLPAGWRIVAETGMGHEAIGPIYTDLDDFRRDAIAATDTLQDFAAEVDPFIRESQLGGPRDAFHVHMSIRDLTPLGARRLGLAYYSHLDAYNDRWAWTGCRWSQPCPTADAYLNVDHLAHPHLFPSGCQDGKCRCRPALNIHERLGTLEARQHPGTLDPDVMTAWIVELYVLAGIELAGAVAGSR